MYGYIYMVINKINGKRYIGKHKSQKFDPRYLGSGVVLKEAKLKYGIENFYSILIETCNSLEELDQQEQFWIETYKAVQNSNFYNIQKGGAGGFDHINGYLPHSHLGKPVEESTKHLISESLKGKPKSSEHKAAISATRIANGSAKGNRNPNWNKVCLTDGNQEIHVPKEQVNDYLVAGWRLGRPNCLKDLCATSRGTVWYTDGHNEKRLSQDQVEPYLAAGWIPGRRPKSKS